MKRTIPLLITTLGGLVMIVSFFVPMAQGAGETAAQWFNILAAIAFVLGGGNLVKVHLKAISDREAGWGYSAIILAAFFATLAIGLGKVGVRPEIAQQYPGETWQPIGEEALPSFSLFRLDPTVPLPASVRGHVLGEGRRSQLVGYLSPEQWADLIEASGDVDWKCAVESLADEAALPESVRGFLRYRPEHRALAAIGPLTPKQSKAADEVVPEDDPRYPAWHAAIVELKDATRDLAFVALPEGVGPAALPGGEPVFPITVVTEGGVRSLRSIGPMTERNRELLLEGGRSSAPAVPMSEAAIASLLSQLDGLSEDQTAIVRRTVAKPWAADDLIAAVDNATAAVTQPRSWCEIAADVTAGDRTPPLTETAGEGESLSDGQATAIREAVDAGDATPDEVIDAAGRTGPLSDAQATAIRTFYDGRESVAERDYALLIALLREGPLPPETVGRLVTPYREARAWRHAVDALYIRSQSVKFPWATPYNREGGAFWWIYEYLFKPLTATMFAMLAFYISSAAFRAFRAKNLEASLLLGTALVVLLGRISLGYLLTDGIDPNGPLGFLRLEVLTEQWIMALFVTAGNRAIMIGIALGVVATSLKILLGIDRSYLGGD